MGLFSLFKKNSSLGLDLGNRWAKLIKLKGSGKKIELERVGRTFFTKEEIEDKEKTKHKIRQLCNSLLIKDNQVNISLAGHSVIIKRLPLPPSEGTPKNYDEIIKKHAKDHIPFDIENVYMDYYIIENTENTDDNPETTKEYFLVASKKNVIHEVQDLVEGCGFRIEAIDVEGFALCNCFEYNYPEYVSKTSYLIDIGSSNTIFCVYSNGSPLIIRDLSIGGDQITEKIKEVLNKNFIECEKIKINLLSGIEPRDRIMINQKIEDLYLRWIDEIQKLIYFHISNYSNSEEVENIFLSGGGSLSPKFKEVMEEHLEKNVEYINPFRKLDISLDNFDIEYIKSISPQFSMATGLALRNFI
jgi:type IV pilus assembly protein PilM